MRKSVLEYDGVMNKQRQVIYAERNKILDGKDLTDHYYRGHARHHVPLRAGVLHQATATRASATWTACANGSWS